MKYGSRCGTILPIFLAIHIVLAISSFMSSQLPSGNIIRGADLLYAYSLSQVRKQKGEVFRNLSQSDDIFRKRKSCNLSGATIELSNSPETLSGPLVQNRNIVRSDHTTRTSKARVSVRLSGPASALVSGFSLPIFPRNP